MATLCCLMIFTSCAKTTRNVNNDEQVVSKELSTKDATGKDIPEWVKGSLGEGTLFEKVGIDGIGGADDEVYIITGRFDDYGSDYRNGLTVVYVHLGTGEVLAQAILCKGNYETRFANLIPGHEGNQIILEITDGNSTYLATNIFVIAVSVDEWQVLLDDKQELEFGGDKQSEPVIPQKQRKKKCVSIIIGFIIILLFGITLFQFWKKNSNEMPVDAIPGEKVETEIIQNFDLEWK